MIPNDAKNRSARIQSGLEGIRIPDLLSAIEIPELSTMSTMYIWRFVVYPITIYGGQNVQEVHNFHAVLPALHRVAPDMKKERRLDAQLYKNSIWRNNWVCQFIRIWDERILPLLLTDFIEYRRFLSYPSLCPLSSIHYENVYCVYKKQV